MIIPAVFGTLAGKGFCDGAAYVAISVYNGNFILQSFHFFIEVIFIRIKAIF